MSFASSHASGMASGDRESPESSFSKSSMAGASTSLWFAFVSRDWDCINVTCTACGAGVSHRSRIWVWTPSEVMAASAGDFGLGPLQIITLSSDILCQCGINRIHMVDLESNIQMWRAPGTKPPAFNRSCAHAEAQASRSCVLVSSEKASHPVSGSGRGLQPQDILKCFNKKNQIFEAMELYGKYSKEFQKTTLSS